MKLKNHQKRGFALITTLVLLSVVFIAVSGLLAITKTELRISRSQKESVQAYYVAEAGIQNAIWQIQHDDELSDDLDAGTLNHSWTSQNQLLNLRNISVTAQSIEPSRAEIVSTGDVNEDQFPAKRVVKMKIFRGLSSTASVLGNYSLYSAGATNVQNSTVNISGADLYSGGNQVYANSTVNASTNSLASIGEYINTNSTVDADNIFASNYPPAPSSIVQPGVDMNDLRNRANATYTLPQFKNLIKGGGNIDLPGPITFINGALNISPSHLNANVLSVTITVHGLLVGNSNINISTSDTVGGKAKTINLIILDDAGGDLPSGMVSRTHTLLKGKGTIDIDGVVYAGNTITFSNTQNMSVEGGVVGSSLTISSSTNLTLNGDPDRIGELLGVVTTPSVIEIDHWEEEY